MTATTPTTTFDTPTSPSTRKRWLVRPRDGIATRTGERSVRPAEDTRYQPLRTPPWSPLSVLTALPGRAPQVARTAASTSCAVGTVLASASRWAMNRRAAPLLRQPTTSHR